MVEVPVPEVVVPPGFRVNVHVPVDGNELKITLPVATEQVGCDMVPITGAEGVAGCALISTFADKAEVQPAALVTVKECVPDDRPVTIVEEVDPDIEPGLIIQFPAGRLLSTTLPVATEHEGCVIAPIIGAEGVSGCTGITTFADKPDMHPSALVTV